jgi:hypothetical protein
MLWLASEQREGSPCNLERVLEIEPENQAAQYFELDPPKKSRQNFVRSKNLLLTVMLGLLRRLKTLTGVTLQIPMHGCITY